MPHKPKMQKSKKQILAEQPKKPPVGENGRPLVPVYVAMLSGWLQLWSKEGPLAVPLPFNRRHEEVGRPLMSFRRVDQIQKEIAEKHTELNGTPRDKRGLAILGAEWRATIHGITPFGEYVRELTEEEWKRAQDAMAAKAAQDKVEAAAAEAMKELCGRCSHPATYHVDDGDDASCAFNLDDGTTCPCPDFDAEPVNVGTGDVH